MTLPSCRSPGVTAGSLARTDGLGETHQWLWIRHLLKLVPVWLAEVGLADTTSLPAIVWLPPLAAIHHEGKPVGVP